MGGLAICGVGYLDRPVALAAKKSGQETHNS
jgi:hypothetical protein